MTIEQQLQEAIARQGPIHLTLIDPDSQSPEEAADIARGATAGGTTAILVGGSVGVGGRVLECTVQEIKGSTKVPTIIFPSDVGSVSPRLGELEGVEKSAFERLDHAIISANFAHLSLELISTLRNSVDFGDFRNNLRQKRREDHRCLSQVSSGERAI